MEGTIWPLEKIISWKEPQGNITDIDTYTNGETRICLVIDTIGHTY